MQKLFSVCLLIILRISWGWRWSIPKAFPPCSFISYFQLCSFIAHIKSEEFLSVTTNFAPSSPISTSEEFLSGTQWFTFIACSFISYFYSIGKLAEILLRCLYQFWGLSNGLFFHIACPIFCSKSRYLVVFPTFRLKTSSIDKKLSNQFQIRNFYSISVWQILITIKSWILYHFLFPWAPSLNSFWNGVV